MEAAFQVVRCIQLPSQPNLHCVKESENQFHREKTTKVFAKSGATIAGIQRLVENSEKSESPELSFCKHGQIPQLACPLPSLREWQDIPKF